MIRSKNIAAHRVMFVHSSRLKITLEVIKRFRWRIRKVGDVVIVFCCSFQFLEPAFKILQWRRFRVIVFACEDCDYRNYDSYRWVVVCTISHQLQWPCNQWIWQCLTPCKSLPSVPIVNNNLALLITSSINFNATWFGHFLRMKKSLNELQLRKVKFRVFYAASEVMSIEVEITFEWQQGRELL